MEYYISVETKAKLKSISNVCMRSNGHSRTEKTT